MEVGVDVGFAILFQNVVDSHHHARVEVVEAGVGLHVRKHRNESHEVGGHNAGESRQIESGRGVGHQRLGDLVEFSELLIVADSVSHVNAAFVALAVAGNGHFGSVSSVFLAQHAGREGGVGAGDAVGMALRNLVLSMVVEVSVVDTLAIGKVCLIFAAQTLVECTALTSRKARRANVSAFARFILFIITNGTNLNTLAREETGARYT